MDNTPAIRLLKDAVTGVLIYPRSTTGRTIRWKRKFLKGLDGRLIHVRSPHSALNSLLQSAGGIICKYWITRTEERLIERGLKHDEYGDFIQMAWVHDEFQASARTVEVGQIIIEEAQKAIRDAQHYFEFNIQLDVEGKIGQNWADCH